MFLLPFYALCAVLGVGIGYWFNGGRYRFSTPNFWEKTLVLWVGAILFYEVVAALAFFNGVRRYNMPPDVCIYAIGYAVGWLLSARGKKEETSLA